MALFFSTFEFSVYVHMLTFLEVFLDVHVDLVVDDLQLFCEHLILLSQPVHALFITDHALSTRFLA